MIKKLIEKYKSHAYQRDPPLENDPRFYRYLNKEVQFYRNRAERSGGEFLTHKYIKPKKNKTEKDL